MKRFLLSYFFLIFLITSCNSTEPKSLDDIQTLETQDLNVKQTISTPIVLPTHTQVSISIRGEELAPIENFEIKIKTSYEENFIRLKDNSFFDFDLATSFDFPNKYFDWLDQEKEIDMSNWQRNNPNIDVEFEIQETEHIRILHIEPWNNVLVGIITEEETSFDNCLYASKTYEGVDIDLSENSPTICIKTSQGNFAVFQIKDIQPIDKSNKQSPYQIEFTYKVWHDDGKPFGTQLPISKASNQIQNSGPIDLDRINKIQEPDIDIIIDELELNIIPINGTMLTRWRGEKLPTYGLCSISSFSTERIVYPSDANTLHFICYKTSDGTMGRLMLRGLTVEESEKSEDRKFSINYETWAIDEILPQTKSNNHFFMSYGDGADLDTGSLIAPRKDIDFRLYTDNDLSEAIIINSQADNIEMAYIGNVDVTKETCINPNYSTVPIYLETTNPKDIICIKTSRGNFGYLEIESIMTQSGFPQNASLSFQYQLWDQYNGYNIISTQIKKQYNNLVGDIPVDLENLLSLGKQDIGFRKNENNQLVAYAVSGAKIAYWGNETPSLVDCNSVSFKEEIIIYPSWANQKTDEVYICIITADNNWGRLSYKGQIGNQHIIQAEIWQLDFIE